MNTTLAFNTGKHEKIFTVDRRFFTVPYNDLNMLSNCTIYRIYLNHHTVGTLIFEEHYIPTVELEDVAAWREVEEKVLYTLANYAVFGTTNLVEQTKRLRKNEQ
jgi:hypothetical protein